MGNEWKGSHNCESLGEVPKKSPWLRSSPRIGPPGAPILQVISLVQVHLKDLSAQQRQWWITIFSWVYRMQVPPMGPGGHSPVQKTQKNLTQPMANGLKLFRGVAKYLVGEESCLNFSLIVLWLNKPIRQRFGSSKRGFFPWFFSAVQITKWTVYNNTFPNILYFSKSKSVKMHISLSLFCQAL